MTRQEIKKRAKEQLGNAIFCNTWLIATGVCFIYALLISAAAGISKGIGALLITGPLSIAISKLFLDQARKNKEMKIEDLFANFSEDYKNKFLLTLMTGIYIFLWSLLFIIPGIVKAYAYSMVSYIKADHSDYDWKKCIDESIKLTNGHKMELFMLDLSFIGWYLLGSLCFGVGVLFVEPYHTAAKAQFYESLIK